jgi:hypothetical protein
MTQVKEKEEIGYAWNCVCDMGNSLQLSMTGNFPKGMPFTSMSEEVDKIRAVFERQQAKSCSRSVEQEIDQLVLRHKSAIDDLERLDSKSEAKGGLSSAERSQREAAVVHIEKLGKDIEFKRGVLNKFLEEAK